MSTPSAAAMPVPSSEEMQTRLAKIAGWIITVLVIAHGLQACSTSKDFSRPKYDLEKRHPR